ncbi:MAG: nucleotidyltransferase family protein [Bacteroidia bacterium]|nr:nucleotidyltransferase family protein [Bacteroidia bacterium]
MHENGIPVVFFKGPILSYILYNDLYVRYSKDIDAIIPSGYISKVDEILLEHGYIRTSPSQSLTSKHYRILTSKYQAFTYIEKEHNLQIEIHWKFFRENITFCMPEDIWKKVNYINIGNNSIPTLTPEILLMYLLIHGSIHMWNRLTWLCDIIRLLDISKKINWEDLWEKAVQYKIKCHILIGLGMAHFVFHVQFPQFILNEIKDNQTVNRFFYKNITALIDSKILRKDPVITLAQINSQMALMESLGAKFSYLNVYFISYRDWELLKLPNSLFFLYYIFRPFFWLYRRVIRKK